MLCCLAEVEESCSDTIPTLFRSVDAQHHPQFHGIVAWRPKSHAIELGRTVKDWKEGRKEVIQWPKYLKNKKGVVVTEKGVPQVDKKMTGTSEDATACFKTITDFVSKHGGPYGKHQWYSDGLAAYSTELFNAACHLWGHPRLSERTCQTRLTEHERVLLQVPRTRAGPSHKESAALG